MATGRRRGRAFIYIALILILLLVLVVAVTRFGGAGITAGTEPAQEPVVAEPTQVPVDVVDIVVTTQEVRRGQELSEGLVQVVSIPREDYTEGVFFNSLEEVVGGRAKMDMKAHTPLTNALVVVKGESGSIPSFEIPKGMVAISIPVSKLSSVSYGLQKGDHVNILVSMMLVDLDTAFQSELPNRTGTVIAPGPTGDQTLITAQLLGPPDYTVAAPSAASFVGRIEIEPTLNSPIFVLPSEPQRPRLVSQTLIQDVVVLQTGYFDLQEPEPVVVVQDEQQAAEQPQAQGQAAEATPPPAPVAPEVVTLIVTPQDAITLNYLMLSGAKLNLVMRSAGDDSQAATEAVTLQFILDQHRIPNPAKLPYGLEGQPLEFISPFPNPGAVPASTGQ